MSLIIEERSGDGGRGKSPKGGGWLRVTLRWLVRIVVILIVLPLVLTPLYRFVDPPASALMLWQMAQGRTLERQWVPIEQISPELVKAVISSEDGRFCEHSGIDWHELQKVVSDEDGPSRGASTLTMQLVKNLFLWPSRSYLRKAVELPLAVYADLVLPKRRIMELYLNVAEWGPDLFGAEAAAQRYFKRPAAKLRRSEAALLAAALPNPIARNPAKPAKYHRRYARTIEKRAAGAGPHVACVLGER